MCGIVGSTGVDESKVQGVLGKLVHRGPDQSGVSTDERLSLGHVRLSIIDLSENGKQPMHSTDDAVSIVFNGEIYNYKELKSELEAKGITFRSASDTEVIIAGYQHEGSGFFERMRGMWAFALYDKKAGKVVLSRDHFGIKPLYYTKQGGTFAFASEVRALRELGLKLEPNTEHYFTYFNLGYFIAPETAYRGVYRVEPREIVSFDLESQKMTHDFLNVGGLSGSEVQGELEGEEAICSALQHTLRDSVAAHFVSDVPVGLLFSGGNDSSLIAALSRELGHTPKAFHLSVEGSIDSEYATRIAEHLGLDLEFLEMRNDELVTAYGEVFQHQDEPFGDTSIIPTTLIYKKIGKASKVVLSGEGGDELFGGYGRHQFMRHTRKFEKHAPFQSFLDTLSPGTHPLALRYLNPTLKRVRNAYLSSASSDVIGAYLREGGIIDYPIERGRLRELMHKRFMYAPPVYKRHPNLFLDRALYLPNNLLFKNDMASMTSSIEARTPLVDREVFDLVLRRFPKDACLSKKYSDKYFLKKVLSSYLPDELVNRPKRGFGFSFEKYHVPSFKDDVEKALQFHNESAEAFGLSAHRPLLRKENADIFIKKYPRFAFSLVSNYKVME